MAGKSVTRGKQRAKALEKSRPEAPGAPPAPVLPDEPLEAKQARAARVLEVMEELYPDAATELEHRNPFELLVATVLSAQATDASVNKATPALFARYPDAASLARATPEEVEPYVKSIGLYRAKARNLVLLARKLVEEHGGEIPVDRAKLQELPGVGWKTATVVLGAAFRVPGIAVDTHLTRLARRLGFSDKRGPEKIGGDLERLFPREKWVFTHHALILFGRYRCTARKPLCEGCPLWEVCLSRGAW
ncbi:Ultraviolet N-glycosylase/AP lyase [Calidithermus terrae]|uniref:Endonuclease III n=1 Tax=Calidithermus terrae TaxID=1408545 RepID=A0A399EH94_9DEIN|nr:Ultraviolet N-glycosylase/AP lyase [Calidithermus terrae]